MHKFRLCKTSQSETTTTTTRYKCTCTFLEVDGLLEALLVPGTSGLPVCTPKLILFILFENITHKICNF